MGGDISLVSSAGEGTSAHLAIPFKKASNRRFLEFDSDALPERLQSDMSVSCRSSSNTGTRTPPESICDLCPAEGEINRPANASPLLQHISRAFPQGVESDLEERRKRHVLVVEDSLFQPLSKYLLR